MTEPTRRGRRIILALHNVVSSQEREGIDERIRRLSQATSLLASLGIHRQFRTPETIGARFAELYVQSDRHP